jgi:hypothetical protein
MQRQCVNQTGNVCMACIEFRTQMQQSSSNILCMRQRRCDDASSKLTKCERNASKFKCKCSNHTIIAQNNKSNICSTTWLTKWINELGTPESVIASHMLDNATLRQSNLIICMRLSFSSVDSLVLVCRLSFSSVDSRSCL